MATRKSTFVGALMVVVLLTSCTRTVTEVQYVEKPVYVEVPVLQSIEVEPVKKPIYYIKNLNENSSPSEVAEAYVNTLKELNAYTKKLEIIVEPLYKKAKDNDKKY